MREVAKILLCLVFVVYSHSSQQCCALVSFSILAVVVIEIKRRTNLSTILSSPFRFWLTVALRTHDDRPTG